MLEFIDGFKTKVVGHVQTTSDTINLPFAAAKKLNDMVEGNHIYLTIKYLDRYEVVKYTKEGEIKNGKIAVERDILGKGRKNSHAEAVLLQIGTQYNYASLSVLTSAKGDKWQIVNLD